MLVSKKSSKGVIYKNHSMATSTWLNKIHISCHWHLSGNSPNPRMNSLHKGLMTPYLVLWFTPELIDWLTSARLVVCNLTASQLTSSMSINITVTWNYLSDSFSNHQPQRCSTVWEWISSHILYILSNVFTYWPFVRRSHRVRNLGAPGPCA